MRFALETVAQQPCPPTHHLCLYHIADCLVKGVHLLWLKVHDDGTDVVQYLFNEWHYLQGLYLRGSKSVMIIKIINQQQQSYSYWVKIIKPKSHYSDFA